MSDRLRVAEVFGPTLQGEGPATGRSAGFVRLMGCNLSCHWCDESATWDASRHNLRATTQLLTADEILQQLPRGVSINVLTGGEPLLQQSSPAFAELVAGMAGQSELHVETNGTLAPSADAARHVTAWVVSPKLPHAGPHRGRQGLALNPIWHGAPYGAYLKVVCRDTGDAERALDLADSARWPRARVWLMPEGVTADVLGRRFPPLAEYAAKCGVNASHRLHILAGVR